MTDEERVAGFCAGLTELEKKYGLSLVHDDDYIWLFRLDDTGWSRPGQIAEDLTEYFSRHGLQGGLGQVLTTEEK